MPLMEAWRYEARQAPEPAWPAPAKADHWNGVRKLNPVVTYDRAFHVAAANGMVYFGSSANDRINALDAVTGVLRWSFFTGGPVRVAPAVWEGKVYAGSDDGRVYCLDGGTGELGWVYDAAQDGRWVIGNGRMISVMPVRTGVVIEDGIAYFAAGLFPLEGVALCALDARAGSERWRVMQEKVSPQGPMLASGTRLYTPQGRVSPAVFNRADGRFIQTFEGRLGGTYALLAGEGLFYGPGASGSIAMVQEGDEDRLASFSGNHMIVRGGLSYLHTADTLRVIDRAGHLEATQVENVLAARARELRRDLRKRRARGAAAESGELGEALALVSRKLEKARAAVARCVVWKRACEHPDALILAGNTLFAGGDGEVAAYDAGTGALLWTGTVEGRAYGLAVADGRLLVSTDRGRIHGFTCNAGDTVVTSPTSRGGTVPAPSVTAQAQHIVDRTGVTQGFALVLGQGAGRLSAALAQKTGLKLIAVVEDAVETESARRALEAQGLYGARVTVHTRPMDPGARHPYTEYFANLVVCTGAALPDGSGVTTEELFRMLRPGGGMAYFDGMARDTAEAWVAAAGDGEWQMVAGDSTWAVARRDPLTHTGSWTHLYADASNDTCSDESRVRMPMALQWFGPPGPRRMVDRHHRNVSPLAKDGRLYIPGDNRLMALDAYNGFLLWQTAIPNLRRLGAPFDCGNMVAGEDACLYVAVEDGCRVLDSASGALLRTLTLPQLVKGMRRFWGYTALVDGLLFGSGRKPDAVYNNIGWASDAYQWGDFKRMVTSDYLFCMDPRSGAVRWSYQGGTIVNPAIAIGGGRVYLVESLSPRAAKDGDGKMKLSELFGDGARLVALDLETGEEQWAVSPDFAPFEQIIFLSYAQETLLISGSRNEGSSLWHVLHAIDAASGQSRWTQRTNTGWGIRGGHGEQTKHAVIIGETIYAEPFAYHLFTGERRAWQLERGGGGCGTLSACSSHLFFRGSNPQMYDVDRDVRRPLNRVNRSGCWINILPAEGLVLVPESSSGCTCAYPVQTSVAYVPKAAG